MVHSSRPSKRYAFFIAAFGFLVTVLLPVDASALPMFARRVGRDCTYCHVSFPKLNETGRIFRSNGYRFEGGEWKKVRDWESVPVSFEVEVEGLYDKMTASGVRTEASNMRVEEVELAAGGPMGKTGRITALGVVVVEQAPTGTGIGMHIAFVQVNDLAGGEGSGVLNLKAGLWTQGMPFLHPSSTPVANAYLAETALGVMARAQRAVELNGALVTPDEESFRPTLRYSLGISRDNVNDDNKLSGYYATGSATVMEKFNLGLIFKGGRASDGAVDRSYTKYGLGAEVETDSFVFTAGWFRSNRSGTTDMENYVAEALWFPVKRVTLAARYDTVREDGKRGAKSRTLTGRYSILSNVYASLEYRLLGDKDHVTSSNEDEKKVRLFLVALF